MSSAILVQPATAQIDRPVEIWPTEGWATSTPEEQGMNSTLLADVYTHVRNSDADIRSMLVVRHGYIVAEEYFIPQLYDMNNTHILFSVTKSVVSSLIGIAIDHGFIDNTNQLLLDFFPDMVIANPSAWKDAITLEDVLMMRTGFAWDETDYTTYDDFAAMRDSDNWAQYVLNSSMANEPGSTFDYNSGASHLLATIINVTTGMTPLAFADQYLFDPLGIARRAWSTDPQGINFGASSLALIPRAMAKFGLLYLNNGTWENQQIVSADWVNRSSHGPATYYTQISYGYQWWIDDDDGWYSARGYNGQFIYVIPEHDIVVVFSSDNEDGPYEYDWLVSNGVLGAITNVYPVTETSSTTTTTTSSSSQTTTQTGAPLTMTYVLIGVASASVAVVIIVIIRLKR
ncbi:MAG: serine hydrolase [Candidatus Thorarchaeota archaeon]